MDNNLSTGIPRLDDRLSGGLAPGSLIALVAEPSMQSEALLYEMMEARPTLYMTTLRDPEAVENDLEGTVDEEFFVEYAGESQTLDNDLLKEMTGTRSFTSSFTDVESELDTVYETVGKVDRQLNMIVDPVNPLEEAENKGTYREVLNQLKTTALETGGIGILHCLTHEGSPPFRDLTLTFADIVLDLDLVTLTNDMEYQLTIPKNRGGKPVLEQTSIVVDSNVWIDDSRNI